MPGILLADDSSAMRALIKRSLEEGGYQVVGEAVDGAEVVTLYQQHQPDVVIMDLAMPGMNGIQAIKQLRALDPKARILLCSGYSAASGNLLVQEALKMGAMAAIPKGSGIKEAVVAAVKQALA